MLGVRCQDREARRLGVLETRLAAPESILLRKLVRRVKLLGSLVGDPVCHDPSMDGAAPAPTTGSLGPRPPASKLRRLPPLLLTFLCMEDDKTGGDGVPRELP